MVASLATSALLEAEGSSFSLLVHPGDLAYSRGYQHQWDNFMTQASMLMTLSENTQPQ
jgi:hypothetical protein